MKRTLAIVCILIFAMTVLCGCQKEAEMVEDMVSTVMATEATNGNNTDKNNGTVTDGDGYIGNDDNETNDNTNTTNNDSRMRDRSVL